MKTPIRVLWGLLFALLAAGIATGLAHGEWTLDSVRGVRFVPFILISMLVIAVSRSRPGSAALATEVIACMSALLGLNYGRLVFKWLPQADERATDLAIAGGLGLTFLVVAVLLIRARPKPSADAAVDGWYRGFALRDAVAGVFGRRSGRGGLVLTSLVLFAGIFGTAVLVTPARAVARVQGLVEQYSGFEWPASEAEPARSPSAVPAPPTVDAADDGDPEEAEPVFGGVLPAPERRYPAGRHTAAVRAPVQLVTGLRTATGRVLGESALGRWRPGQGPGAASRPDLWGPPPIFPAPPRGHSPATEPEPAEAAVEAASSPATPSDLDGIVIWLMDFGSPAEGSTPSVAVPGTPTADESMPLDRAEAAARVSADPAPPDRDAAPEAGHAPAVRPTEGPLASGADTVPAEDLAPIAAVEQTPEVVTPPATDDAIERSRPEPAVPPAVGSSSATLAEPRPSETHRTSTWRDRPGAAPLRPIESEMTVATSAEADTGIDVGSDGAGEAGSEAPEAPAIDPPPPVPSSTGSAPTPPTALAPFTPMGAFTPAWMRTAGRSASMSAPLDLGAETSASPGDETDESIDRIADPDPRPTGPPSIGLETDAPHPTTAPGWTPTRPATGARAGADPFERSNGRAATADPWVLAASRGLAPDPMAAHAGITAAAAALGALILIAGVVLVCHRA